MKAFITGVSGQDGAYLAELLLSKGYEVHGTVRRSSSINTVRIDDLISQFSSDEKFVLHYSDLLDSSSLTNLILNIQPDEVYNLAAQSFVGNSYGSPVFTSNVNALGVTRILEAIRHFSAKTKFYQASTSEMYGNSNLNKQNEKTTPIFCDIPFLFIASSRVDCRFKL